MNERLQIGKEILSKELPGQMIIFSRIFGQVAQLKYATFEGVFSCFMGKMGKITHARVRNKKKSEHEIKKKVYIIIFLNIRKVYFFFE